MKPITKIRFEFDIIFALCWCISQESKWCQLLVKACKPTKISEIQTSTGKHSPRNKVHLLKTGQSREKVETETEGAEWEPGTMLLMQLYKLSERSSPFHRCTSERHSREGQSRVSTRVTLICFYFISQHSQRKSDVCIQLVRFEMS